MLIHGSNGTSNTTSNDEIELFQSGYFKDPYHYAALGDYNNLYRTIIDGFDVNSVDPYGFTLLMYAAVCGKFDIVAFLLDNGANPNVISRSGHWTALTLAVSNRHFRIIKILLRQSQFRCFEIL